jgi:hypothetical protein
MITAYDKPKRWQCLPTTFAMLTGLTPKGVMTYIGHDGSDITHPGLPEPLKRRGFHIQEIIDVAFELGYAMTEIQYYYSITPLSTIAGMQIIEGDDASRRFEEHIHESRGILATHTKVGGHSWAYENGIVYDPDGKQPPREYDLQAFLTLGHMPKMLWRLDPIAD